MRAQKKGHMKPLQVGFIYKPKKEASGKTNPASTLIYDFQTQNRKKKKKKSVVSINNSLGYFLITAQAG